MYLLFFLLLNLVAGLLSLLLAGTQVVVDEVEGLGRQDDAGGEQGLASGNDAVAADPLSLGVVDVEKVVGRLLGLDDGVESHLFALGLNALRGLLDDGDLLVNLVERTGTEAVRLLDIGRQVELVGLLQVEHKRSGKDLVGGITKL